LSTKDGPGSKMIFPWGTTAIRFMSSISVPDTVLIRHSLHKERTKRENKERERERKREKR